MSHVVSPCHAVNMHSSGWDFLSCFFETELIIVTMIIYLIVSPLFIILISQRSSSLLTSFASHRGCWCRLLVTFLFLHQTLFSAHVSSLDVVVDVSSLCFPFYFRQSSILVSRRTSPLSGRLFLHFLSLLNLKQSKLNLKLKGQIGFLQFWLH